MGWQLRAPLTHAPLAHEVRHPLRLLLSAELVRVEVVCQVGWLHRPPPLPSQPLQPTVTTQAAADALMQKHPPRPLNYSVGVWVSAPSQANRN